MMQEIDKLLDHVTISAASVCSNLTTIKTSFDELKKEIEELKTCKENLLKELEETCRTKELDLKNHNKRDMALVDELAGKNDEIKKLKEEIGKTRTCKNVEIGMLKEENDNLKAQNERLKTEVKEALAKRDYYQDLANKEATDAKKVKWDCEKEMEWQRNKLQEFDYVLTKYKAKIKELEDANGFSELVINLIVKE